LGVSKNSAVVYWVYQRSAQ